MSNIILNHGVTLDRKCNCRGTGNDLQLLNTDKVTNYGLMRTGKCKGKANPLTLKLKTFINHGTLVLHKCHCNAQLLHIIDLINYGTVINCMTTCKLSKENELKEHVESKESNAPDQESLETPLDLSASSSSVLCPEEITKFADLPKKCNESRDVSSKGCTVSPNKTLKRSVESGEPTGNPPKQLALNTVLKSIYKSSQQNMGSSKECAIPVQYPNVLQMCPSCIISFQNEINHPKNVSFIPKIRKYKCPYCLNSKANQIEYKAHTAICQQEPKPYKCPGCPYKSTKSSSVNGHSATCFFLLVLRKHHYKCVSLKHCSN
ncbi:uncharacterized protein LOC6606441 [Drosophila sechellia]|uniref:uncharacterized protein LOC6606441 n=1 Tax=Drosophila sechellia TaxID=7238 RepID=UPI0013DDC0A9|nr:uncharacterized protein LOC6606441 [Drosophila sechellia]